MNVRRASRASVAHQLAAILTLCAGVSVLVVGSISYLSGQAALEDAAKAELYARAIEKQRSIEYWLDLRLTELERFARALDVSDAEVFALASDNGSAPAVLDRLQQSLERRVIADDDFLGLMLLEPDHGRAVAVTGPADLGRSYETQPFFIAGRKAPWAGNLIDSEAEVERNMRAPVVAVPLRSGPLLLGVLAARLNPTEIGQITGRRSGLRHSEDAYVVDSQRMLLSIPDILDEGPTATTIVDSEAVRRCLGRTDGLVLADDHRGVPSVSVYRWLAREQWCLIVKMDEAEAFAPARGFGRTLTIIGLVLLLPAAALAWWLARAITRPIRAMQDVAERITAGRRDLVLQEQGPKELGALARAFNRMTGALANTEHQLMSHATELEERIAEKTQELADRAHALARSNAELERFAYVASHDLQEPLRMVASYTQLLGRRYKGKLDADADEFIGFAVDGATRMQALINDLLSYARISTNARPLAPVDSGTALDRALANLRVALNESGASIRRGELPTINADDGQLTQLFQNLVGNAIKFRGKRPPEIEIDAVRKRQDWVFRVSDNGIGIDPEFADQLFVMFKRLHSRAEYPGTGIGLAICKRIVERQGGRIWIESQPGVGATFFFTQPVRDAEEQRGGAGQAVADGSAPHPHARIASTGRVA